jgi:hypothetical protein
VEGFDYYAIMIFVYGAASPAQAQLPAIIDITDFSIGKSVRRRHSGKPDWEEELACKG